MDWFIPNGFVRRILALIVAILPILFISDYLHAEQASDLASLSLEELLNVKVYSASKYEQKASEAPSSISVITAADINTYGYRTLSAALQSLPGFYMLNHGTYSSLGVRGFSPAASRILLLVNGHSLNDNISNSTPLGADFPIDMDLIERIEVVRGPSSSLYGAGAFFAVVNVITRTGKQNSTQVSVEAGSLGTYKTTAIYGVDHRGTQALFSVSYWDTAAPGHLDSVADPVGSPSAHDQSRRAFALVSSHGFTMQAVASALQQRVSDSPQACGACHQSNGSSNAFRGYIDVQYDHPVWKAVQLTARTYYDTTASHAGYNDLRVCSASTCHGQVLDHGVDHGDWVGAELKLTRHFLDRHRVTIGAEYRDNFRQAQQNYIDGFADTTSGPLIHSMTFVNYNRTSAIWGLYGESEFRLHPKLILNAGVRNDRYNYLGSTTNPRAALIYNPQKSTTLKFLFGTAFRAPSFSELYYAAGPVFQSAPTLKPETIRTQEGILEQQFGSCITASVAVFYNHIGSYINEESTPTGLGVLVNTASANAKGGEFELRGKLSSAVEGRLSYTLQDARDGVTGASLPDAPRHLVKLNVSAPLARGRLVPAIEAQYMGRWLTTTPGYYAAPPVLLNASLSTRQLWRGFSLSAGAYNLMGRPMGDRANGYVEGVPPENFVTLPASSLLTDDRRTFRFKLNWTSRSERADREKPAAQKGTL